jgi:hypothetical protein
MATCLLLAACVSGEQLFIVGTQTWSDVEVTLEARQSPADPATFEFLVIGTNQRRLPANNLTVSIRLADQEPWKQAIQDGLVGVYRRAYRIGDPKRQSLQVQLRRGEEEAVLRFDLAALAGAPAKP